MVDNNNGKTFTLAEVREREREVLNRIAREHSGRDAVPREWICNLRDEQYPEVYNGPVVEHDGFKFRLSPDGSAIEELVSAGWGYFASVAHIQAVLPLLPRVPVEVTEKQKKIPQALQDAIYNWGAADRGSRAKRAWEAIEAIYAHAITAVAADLAQPNATTCQHKATRWAVKVPSDGSLLAPWRTRVDAERSLQRRGFRDECVVALAEVEG